MYRHFFKRIIDFCVALVALVCISPVLIVVAIWLHFANKGAGAFFLPPYWQNATKWPPQSKRG